MGDSNGLRLENWLKKLLRDKVVPGLVWVNETEEIFKIPWANQKSCEWIHGKEDSKILIEWAKHKYGFQIGQREDLPRWKTNLRCAINKNPNIERLKNDDTKFHMMCKFVSLSNSISDSPASTSSQYSSSVKNPGEMATDTGQDFLIDSQTENTEHLVPTFLQSFEIHPFEDVQFVSSNSLAPDEDVMETESPSLTNQLVGLTEYFNQEPLQIVYLDSTSSYNAQHEFPPEGNIDLASAQHAVQPAQTASQLVDHPAQSAQPPEKASPILILEVAYDVPHRPVMYLKIDPTTPRCRIFSGNSFRKAFYNEVVPPDLEEFEVELLSVENVQDLQEKNKKKISDILDRFERGVGIFYDENGDIWAERRSSIKIFYTDEQNFSHPLPRKHLSESGCGKYTKIFAYSQFIQDLKMHLQDRSHRRPKDYVLLTLGHECELDVLSPLRKVLVHIKVRHIQATKDFIALSGGEETSSNPNSMYSLPDSLDKVVTAMSTIIIDQQNDSNTISS